jgi:hypothetical protein
VGELWGFDGIGRSSHSYAAERWAKAVERVIRAPEDTRTMRVWGKMVGVSSASLAMWCRAAQASPRRSLELGRLSRAVLTTDGTLGGIQDVLDIVDPKTIRRLLQRAGVSPMTVTGQRMTLGDFLQRQQLVTHEFAIRALRHRLLTTPKPS